MRKDNCNSGPGVVARRLAEMRMSEYDREHALAVLEAADRIAGGILWIREKARHFGLSLLTPGLKH